MARLEISRIVCHDSQENADEPYLLIDGQLVELRGGSMVTGEMRDINRTLEVGRDANISLWEADIWGSVPRPAPGDDQIGFVINRLHEPGTPEFPLTFAEGSTRYVVILDWV